ncbi:ABC transporter permease [Humidisolicoccus flavus]|uniref:ABC transporter permease n=1 Tax=Humidisolicoccus flavus TaxID=3111414 RepID=UPI00324E1723
MLSFILRRILVSILVLVAASFIMYTLVALSKDPLSELYASSAPNKDQLIAQRTEWLNLDMPIPVRWAVWFGGAAGCLVPFTELCNLGVTLTNQPVVDLLPRAIGSTVQLVTGATILAIILGIGIGIVSALRQYSAVDYTFTFLSFFLYSLPSFLVAVLLKEFLAIGFNDFLRDPLIATPVIIVLSLVAAILWQAIIGGRRRRRLITFGTSAIATAIMLWYMSETDWFRNPGLGPVVVPVLIIGVSLGLALLIAGPRNRRALITSGIVAVLGIISYFSLQGLFNISSMQTLIILGIAALAVGILAGILVGGHDRSLSARIGGIAAVISGGIILLDRFMQSWNSYLNLGQINNRPIATIGSATPNLGGDVWIQGLDNFTHFLLPTVALLLISFAGYSRYSRAGMLEVLNQDYIRTARAKGLPERTVIVRHALRNALIPLATLVAADIGALLGGAIITERIFAISGMGTLFNQGLVAVDPNPVMAYFVVIAITAILFNFLADLAYSALDPRVRVR